MGGASRFWIVCCAALSSCAAPPTCDVSKLTGNMSTEDVKLACGKPDHINASTYGEQWVYGGSSYVYIRDGRFSSAQWTR